MAELERVVEELARIREDHFGGMTSYEGEVLDAAIALLRAQAAAPEPKEVIYDDEHRHELIQELEWYRKNVIPDMQPEYIDDIITVLKAQEPVAPIFDYDGRDVWRCGNCHRNIFHPTRTDGDEDEKNYRRFCFHCGRPVKWNGLPGEGNQLVGLLPRRSA